MGMKMIVGLGNPGSEYAHTRHNMGFEVVDRLAEKYQIRLDHSKFKALFGKGTIDGNAVILVKPLTYMNASGEAVGPLLHFFKLVPDDDLLVIHDDMDLNMGRLRLRHKGSSGGHNGIKSLILHLGTENFARIKVGVGHPERTQQAVVNYVLSRFNREEQAIMEDTFERASDAAAAWLSLPFSELMNRFNASK
ncbi:aminoacyl-tRNA hydrolase [Sporolactobacillus vineae]|uniref:aminoacyl-tRNA hydrolase n=1 Tax=Sporolactobacillus vineae TaxID=444463 RepID=UPI000289AB9D|nr:aminoacyl-tRNA hydrolase [Sporolactobacillus vineae]